MVKDRLLCPACPSYSLTLPCPANIGFLLLATQSFPCSGQVTRSLIGGPGRRIPTLAPRLSRGSVPAGVGNGIFIPRFSEVG